MQVRINEVLTPELLERFADHIRDFLAFEGVVPAPVLGETELAERKLKELLEELVEADGK